MKNLMLVLVLSVIGSAALAEGPGGGYWVTWRAVCDNNYEVKRDWGGFFLQKVTTDPTIAAGPRITATLVGNDQHGFYVRFDKAQPSKKYFRQPSFDSKASTLVLGSKVLKCLVVQEM
ncbi:MAG: hypothetical protein V4736_04295 [Bdellovibrionota bacterium]